MKITIVNKDGQTIGSDIEGALTIRTANASDNKIRIYASLSERTATLSSPEYNAIYDQAMDRILNKGVYIQTINGTAPTDDGAFFINGSGCISWSYLKPGDKEEEVDTSHTDMNGAITVTDLCAACSSCDTMVRIRKIVEGYKIMLNSFKDVNLYTDAQAVARRQYLESKRTAISEACKSSISSDDLAILELTSNQLLGQYMTVVHMWNYLASRKDNATEIVNTPEAATGFNVATKFEKPICNEGADVSCTVKVSLYSGQTELSLYIPDPEVIFSNADDGVESPETGDGGGPFVINKTMSSSTTATITMNRDGAAGTKRGTYTLSFKCLPYKHVTTTNKRGIELDLSIYDTNAVSVDTATSPKGGTDYTYNLMLQHAITTKVNATYEDYISKQNYLGVASTATNRWKVEVTWSLLGDIATTKTDTFYFETPGVREIRSGMFKDSVLHNPV